MIQVTERLHSTLSTSVLMCPSHPPVQYVCVSRKCAAVWVWARHRRWVRVIALWHTELWRWDFHTGGPPLTLCTSDLTRLFIGSKQTFLPAASAVQSVTGDVFLCLIKHQPTEEEKKVGGGKFEQNNQNTRILQVCHFILQYTNKTLQVKLCIKLEEN